MVSFLKKLLWHIKILPATLIKTPSDPIPPPTQSSSVGCVGYEYMVWIIYFSLYDPGTSGI